MESPSTAPTPDPSSDAILTRAEQAVTRAGERLLVERLHQALDQEGSAALTVLSDTLLPLLQALVMVLPQAVVDGASPAVLAAAQTLGAAVHERGITLPALATEGLQAHDHLLREIVAGLRENDRPLVEAVLRISRTILEVEREILLAYQDSADAALALSALSDPSTGLASPSYFTERLANELQRSRRRDGPLALVLIACGGGPSTDNRLPHPFAAVLRRQLRGIDLAAYRADHLFALLLLETGRDGAEAFLRRLDEDAARHNPPLRFAAGVAVYPDQGATADVLVEQAERALSRTTRGF